MGGNHLVCTVIYGQFDIILCPKIQDVDISVSQSEFFKPDNRDISHFYIYIYILEVESLQKGWVYGRTH